MTPTQVTHHPSVTRQPEYPYLILYVPYYTVRANVRANVQHERFMRTFARTNSTFDPVTRDPLTPFSHDPYPGYPSPVTRQPEYPYFPFCPRHRHRSPFHLNILYISETSKYKFKISLIQSCALLTNT